MAKFRKGVDHPGKFKPGASGNPGGIPSETREALREVKTLAQQHGEAAFDRLLMLMQGSGDERVQLQAAREVLDRAYGKPPIAITGEGGGPIGVDVHGEALYQLIKKLAE